MKRNLSKNSLSDMFYPKYKHFPKIWVKDKKRQH